MKATLNDTPAAQLVAKASETTEVTDARGRVITLKKPGVLAQYRLVEILGDTAKNEVYMGMVLPLIFVTAIDGDLVTLSRKSEVEALIQRLDEHGILAVADAVTKNYGKPDAEADKATLKN